MINADKMTTEELIRYTQLDETSSARELELCLRLADALDEIEALTRDVQFQKSLKFVN